MLFKKAFTTFENIAVAGILVGIALVIIGNINTRKEAQLSARIKADLELIQGAVSNLKHDTGESPLHLDTEECASGPIVNLQDPGVGLITTDGRFQNWQGPYLNESVSTDPWGEPYYFNGNFQCFAKSGCENAWGLSSQVIQSSGSDKGLNTASENELSDDFVAVICAKESKNGK